MTKKPENQNQALFSLNVSEDKMRAFLSFSPPDGKRHVITATQMLRFIENEEISAGILHENLRELANAWNKEKKKIENALVAEGVFPSYNEPSLLLSVLGVCEKPAVDAIHRLPIKHHTMVEAICPCDKVTPGQMILNLSKQDVVVDGFDVYGTVMNDVRGGKIETGKGVTYYPNRNGFLAEETGIVTLLQNKLSVIPVIYDAYVLIEMAEGNKAASATILPPEFDGEAPSLAMVKDALARQKIVSGFQSQAIDEAIDVCLVEKRAVKVIAAKDTEPVNGKDGWIKPMLDLERSLKPAIREDGSADFKTVSVIKPVKKMQPLATLESPTPGKPGTSIFGKTLPAIDGRPMRMPMGSNTELAAHDENLLVASVAGNARYKRKTIEVSECFVLKGDVDYSTGNISYGMTILVHGDVKSGFNLDVGRDVEIHGIVEDSLISSGGALLVKSGFIGTGQGVIRAKENVGILYIRNQTVYSRKDIHVAKEVVNAHMYARGSVDVGGGKIGILGGKTVAKQEIVCQSAGNEAGIKTILEVGRDYTLSEDRLKTESKILDFSKKRARAQSHIKRLQAKQKKPGLAQKEKLLLKRLLSMEMKMEKQLKVLGERISVVKSKEFELQHARVIIQRMCFPGVQIKMGEFTHLVSKKLNGTKTFILKESGIEMM